MSNMSFQTIDRVVLPFLPNHHLHWLSFSIHLDSYWGTWQEKKRESVRKWSWININSKKLKNMTHVCTCAAPHTHLFFPPQHNILPLLQHLAVRTGFHGVRLWLLRPKKRLLLFSLFFFFKCEAQNFFFNAFSCGKLIEFAKLQSHKMVLQGLSRRCLLVSETF